MDGPGTPPADGQPSGPSPAQAAAAAAARQAVAYRLLGAACALVGVLLVVGGLLALRGRPSSPPPAAGAASTAPSTSPARTTRPAPSTSTPPPSTPPRTTVAPATTKPTLTRTAPATVVVRAPLTVLNNTTRAHLAERAAETFRAGGWQVVKVGNFTGTIPSTTAYFTPGSSTEERAARALAAQFRGIARVLPRYSGLPSSVHGVIVVLAPDWPG